MIFVNILILIAVFVFSSWSSGFVLKKWGYPPPKKLASREDYILFAMKITTFSIIALLLMALLMVLGLDPLRLMGQD